METISPDDPADGIWMSKAELAAARTISTASADRLIRRHGWRKQPGNDGRVRVLVPRTWVENYSADPLDKPVIRPPGTAASPTDIQEALSALQAAITVLREQQEAERGGWREDRMRLLEEIRDLRTERDQAVVDLRTECDRSTAERERTRILLEQVAASTIFFQRGSIPRERCSDLIEAFLCGRSQLRPLRHSEPSLLGSH